MVQTYHLCCTSKLTLLDACVAIPKPKDVLAVAPLSVTKLEPSPTIKLLSVGVSPAISDNLHQMLEHLILLLNLNLLLQMKLKQHHLSYLLLHFLHLTVICIAEETPET